MTSCVSVSPITPPVEQRKSPIITFASFHLCLSLDVHYVARAREKSRLSKAIVFCQTFYNFQRICLGDSSDSTQELLLLGVEL